MRHQDIDSLQIVVSWLYETFPKAFFRAKKKVKPLQLGIVEDVLDVYERLDVQPFSRKRLRSAINFYTSTKGYLEAQFEGAYRIDVYGHQVEPVTKSQAEYAKEKLAEKSAKKDEVITDSDAKLADTDG